MERTTHPIDREDVMAYVDGELTVDRASAVAAHLDQCDECRALAADLRSVSRQLSTWQVEPAPAGLSARVRAAIEEPARKPSSPLPVSPTAPVRVARRVPMFGWAVKFALAVGALVVIAAISIPNLLRTRMPSNLSSRAGSSGYGRGGDTTGPSQLPTGPLIVRTASLTMETRDFESTRAAIEQLIRRHTGTVAQMNVTSYRGSGHSLTATFRVPADQLNAVIAELKKLARVEHESQSGDEVTEQYVDLVARLTNARKTEQRLGEILKNRTGTVSDILSVEREMARVRGEIERMEAERQALANRVAMATIQVQLNEEYRAELEPAPPSAASRLRNAVVDGYHNFTEGALDLLLFLLRYGPSLFFWVVVLGWPTRLLWRRWQTSKQ